MNNAFAGTIAPQSGMQTTNWPGYRSAGVLMSLLFAALIISGPWEAIRGDAFADLANYRTRIYQLHDYGIRYFVWEDSLLGWLRYEFLWFRLLAFVADHNIHPNTFIAAIVGISAFFTHTFLRNHLGTVFATLILLNPITIDLLSSQIRSAVAFSIFLFVVSRPLSTSYGWSRHLLLLPLPFIHTGLLLMLAIYAGSLAMAHSRVFLPRQKALTTIAAGIVLAAAIVLLLPTIVEATEDRRDIAQYGLKSAAYLSYWGLCAGALIFSANEDTTARWEYFFALIICLIAPVLELCGLPGFRFVALAIPVIFVALARMRGGIFHGLVFATLAYQFLLILYWIQ